MIELDLNLCKELKQKGISIIVDSKHTLHEAGELIQAEFDETQLIEIHELCADFDATVTTEYWYYSSKDCWFINYGLIHW